MCLLESGLEPLADSGIVDTEEETARELGGWNDRDCLFALSCRMPKYEPQGEVAKSFMEHLRAVHFALLATCLALFAATLPEPPEDLRLAKRDLLRIQAAIASGSLQRLVNRAFLLAAYGNAFHSRDTGTYGVRLQYRDSGEIVEVLAKQRFTSLPLEDLAVPVARVADKMQDRCGRVEGDFGAAEFKVNLTDQMPLGDFIGFWDCLEMLRAVRIIDIELSAARPVSMSEAMAKHFPNNFVAAERVAGPWANLNGILSSSAAPALAVGLSNGDAVLQYDPSLDPKATGFGFVEARYVKSAKLRGEAVFTMPITFPVSTRSTPIPAQRLLAEEFFPGVATGVFARRFPQLSTWSINKVGRTPAVLLEDIGSELERTSDTFEIFGVKIPLSLVAKLGILVLVGLESYFTLHLRRFRFLVSGMSGSFDFPWLGVYRDATSRGVFAMVTVGLPVAVTILLLVHAHTHLSIASLTSLSLLFAAIQVSLTIELLRFWRALLVASSAGSSD